MVQPLKDKVSLQNKLCSGKWLPIFSTLSFHFASFNNLQFVQVIELLLVVVNSGRWQMESFQR
jgi:hypothetical protein